MPNYVKPVDLYEMSVLAGAAKTRLPLPDMIIRGIFSGFLLACAASCAYQFNCQTGMTVAGSLVFGAGFTMIVLYGFELVTGNMTLVPMAVLARRTTLWLATKDLLIVYVCNFVGAGIFLGFFYGGITYNGKEPTGGALGAYMVSVAKGKTITYKNFGTAGWFACFLKGCLCNVMVSYAAYGSLVSTSVCGKIVALWMPIIPFAALGFEHIVVNMYVVPMGMSLGAPITMGDYMLWSVLPSTLGDLFGSIVLIAIPYHFTWGHDFRKKAKVEAAAAAEAEAAEAAKAAADKEPLLEAYVEVEAPEGRPFSTPNSTPAAVEEEELALPQPGGGHYVVY